MDNDPEGYVEFVASRGTQLFRMAYLLTGERYAAEDLVQITLGRLYGARTPAQSGQPLAVEVVDGEPIIVGDNWSARNLVLRWTSAGFVNEPAPAKPTVLYGATVHEGRFWALGSQPGKIDGVDDTYLAHTRP